MAVALPVAAVLLSLLYTFNWAPFGFILVASGYLFLLIAVFLPLYFLWTPASNKTPRTTVPWYDIVLMVLGAIIPLYFYFNAYEMKLLGWEMRSPTGPFLLALILWVLMIEAGRRAAGPVFALVILVFSAYPLFARFLPGFLESQGFSLNRVASFHVLSEESLLGIPLGVFGSIVFGFMVFSATMQALGAGRFFGDVALVFIGKTRASNAKIAIVASALFGTISGAAVANVMTTGSFTIPAMKKEGLPPYFAGAVEASASSAGTLMPPVMGATAFVMAEFLGVPYTEVAIAAAVPSVLYYVCLFSQIDAFAARTGLSPAAITVEVPPLWRTLANNLHLISGFIVLVAVLFLLRLYGQAPWMATTVVIALGMFRKETRLIPRRLLGLIEDIGRVCGELLCIMAPVGLIIGGFIVTGLAFSFPYEIVALAGGNVYLMLIFGAVAAFILGMGVTNIAVYIFLALVLAPGLVEAGFDRMAIHLFILYTAMWSFITPPVALAAFAAATIAGSDPMKTGFQAMKLGYANYILPFAFALNPVLILRGSVTEMLWAIPTAAIGLVIISGALEGYFWRLGSLMIPARVLLFGVGMLTLVPNLAASLYGIGAFAVIFAFTYFLRGRQNRLARLMLRPG